MPTKFWVIFFTIGISGCANLARNTVVGTCEQQCQSSTIQYQDLVDCKKRCNQGK